MTTTVIVDSTESPAVVVSPLDDTPKVILTPIGIQGPQGAAGASSAPGGADKQVQFNNSGAFGGDTNFTYDSLSKTLKLSSGSVVAPVFDVNSGLGRVKIGYNGNTDGLSFWSGGAEWGAGFNGGLSLAPASGIFWGAAGNLASTDLALRRDAANALALRNGLNAQSFNLYNKYIDPTSYERGYFRYVNDELHIGHEAAGTGNVQRTIRIKAPNSNLVLEAFQGLIVTTFGATRWATDSQGHTATGADSSYDWGSATFRWRDIYAGRTGYFGTSVISPVFDGALATREGSLTRVAHPKGAATYFFSSTIGAIKIALPQGMVNTMLKFRVTLMNYVALQTAQAGGTRVFEVTGYTNVGGWYDMRVDQISGPETPVTVRFGIEATTGKACVWFGETNTGWSYLGVAVSDVHARLNTDTVSNWASGWAISLDTDLTGDTVQLTQTSHSCSPNSGTFTPVLTFGGGSVGMAYSARDGTYEKQGRTVFGRAYFRLSAKGTSVGQAIISGLPFPQEAGAAFTPHVMMMNSGPATVTGPLTAYQGNNSTQMTLAQGGGSLTVLNDTHFDNDTEVLVSFSYLVA